MKLFNFFNQPPQPTSIGSLEIPDSWLSPNDKHYSIKTTPSTEDEYCLVNINALRREEQAQLNAASPRGSFKNSQSLQSATHNIIDFVKVEPVDYQPSLTPRQPSLTPRQPALTPRQPSLTRTQPSLTHTQSALSNAQSFVVNAKSSDSLAVNSAISTHQTKQFQPLTAQAYKTQCLMQIFECFSDPAIESNQIKSITQTKNFLRDEGYIGQDYINLLSQFETYLLDADESHQDLNRVWADLFEGQARPDPIIRLDKRATGFKHTLLFSNTPNTLSHTSSPKLYKLMQHFEVEAVPDLSVALLAELVDKDPIQRHRIQARPDGQFNLVFGQGNSGKVYAGQNIKDGRLVAIKSIKELSNEYKFSTQEFAASQAIKTYLGDKPKELQRYFILAEDHIKSFGKDGNPCGYLVENLNARPDTSQIIKHIHALPTSSRQRIALLQKLGVQLLTLGSQLEQHNICHPDLKPSNIINGKLCDINNIWLNGKGHLSTHSPAFFPPRRLLDLSSDSDFQTENTPHQDYQQTDFIQEDFHGVTRFTIGTSLIQAVTGQLPHQFARGHMLALPFSIGRKTYLNGFKETQVPLFELEKLHIYNEVEVQLMEIAKAMMQDKPQDRLSSQKALDLLQALQ